MKDELDAAIRETPIHLLKRADDLLRITAQAQMRELQEDYSRGRLERFGFRVFSQHDEDGIIQEILRRISLRSGHFLEFGSGTGIESNCAYLLLQGWTGAWVDSNSQYVELTKKTFAKEASTGRLGISCQTVTTKNIAALIGGNNPDLLSIDVDGNDYYLLEVALLRDRPKVVVVEYNAAFPPPAVVVQQYDPLRLWDGTSAYGASLQALVNLANKHGYALVGTNITGVNAFFVRADLVSPEGQSEVYFFSDIDNPSRLYNSARYRLGEFGFDGHPPGWGAWR